VHNNFGGYGLPKASSNGQEVNPFKYGGKELSTDLSLSYYDFEARMQLPALGIFQRPDPKAREFPSINTYSYCGGDPANRVDKNGQEWEIEKTNIGDHTNVNMKITGHY
jgi:RHS repeat-associated protein